MARLLFLGASVSQLPAIRYAREQGHFVAACDGDPEAVGFAACDVAEAVDFTDVDRLAEIARRHEIDGVLAVCTDRAVVPAAAVAERCGLPGLEVSTAIAMTDKSVMRSTLARAGVSQPNHAILTPDGSRAAADSIGLPAVLKPVDSGGQRGIHRIERRDELDRHLAEALAVSRSETAILEDFVDGAEVNTLFAVREGVPTLLTISDRLRPEGLGFGVGWVHLFPSSISPEVASRVEATASRAIEALGLRNGIAFPQLLVTDDDVVVVEVAARIAAGQMADLVRHGTGIELFEIAIRQSIGEPVPDELVTPKRIRPVAIRFLTASPGVLPVGTVTSIEGLDRVRAAEGVLDAGLYFGPGTPIGPLRVDSDRRGYVIAEGSTPLDALDRANAASRLLRIRTERDEGPR